jgi:hypothetical protein
VTITSLAHNTVLVHADATIESSSMAGMISIGVSYQSGATTISPSSPGLTAVAPTPANFLDVSPPLDNTLDYGVSWVYANLAVGTYQFGFVYETTGTEYSSPGVITTAIVF